ncbi:MAG: acyl-CoA dehydrogenase family protein [Curvibacter sp.]
MDLKPTLDEQLALLSASLAATAVERDRRGGHAAAERALLRDSGLLALAVPARFGGQGADWPTVLRAVRRIAAVDSALAHLFAFQHLQVASITFFGSEEQQADLLTRTVQERWFWGNALNPADRRTTAAEFDEGLVLNGVKSFCSGAVGADVLLVSAYLECGRFIVAAIPARREGVQIEGDWNAIGQRQTDSGNVIFTDVLVEPHELLQPGPGSSPWATLRSCLAQSILVNIYLGIAEGADQSAREHTTRWRRPWISSGVEQATQDPYLLQHFGEFWVQLQAARALADEAAVKLEAAWQRGPQLTAEERGAVSVAVATAKVLAHRASLDISSRLFDVAGTSALHAPLGLDRYWRNARTHTLHDPLDYKLRDLGQWALNGVVPAPGSYS